MARRILLTGAGFSKNWGGYLAREVWERLLGHPRVRAHQPTRQALLNAPDDFEAALATLRRSGEEEAAHLEAALVEVFEEQDRCENVDWFDYYRDKFSGFLDGFRRHDGTSCLFTVNQDLFMERNYQPSTGLFAPGVGNVALEGASDPFSKKHRHEIVLEPATELALGRVNYVKLHGSFNWSSKDGNRLVVAGGERDAQAPSPFPLLERYHQLFREACADADAWLVVAGYSFRDERINAAIREGSRAGLRLVVLDTQPPKALRASPGLRDDQIWSALVGYCSEPLIEVLRGHPLADKLIASWLGAGDRQTG